MPIITTTKQMKPRADSDFYETPEPLVRAALDLLPWSRNGLGMPPMILDPGAGSGVWGRVAQEAWKGACYTTGVELRDVPKPAIGYKYWYPQTNFLTWDYPGYFDFVVGNPPFGVRVLNEKTGKMVNKPLAEKFLRKAMSMLGDGGMCLFLLRLAFLESAERYALFAERPPKLVYVCVQRPSFAGYDGGTDATAYMIAVFKKGWRGSTTLDWLNWKE